MRNNTGLGTVRRGWRWLALAGVATTAAVTGVAATPAYADSPQSGHTYRIATTAWLALDVAHASQDGNAPVIQWPFNGGPNQTWRVQDQGDGTDYIINVNSGQCLSVSGPSLAPGAALVQYQCYGVATQKWVISPVNAGTAYEIHSAAQYSNVVDVPGNQTANWGTPIEQWTDNNGLNQQFFFTALS
jgi:alpha-L-fucosidase 2